MKKIMYSLFFLSCFLLSSVSFAQLLNFGENFDYPAGDSLNTHGWVAHSQPGVNPVMVVAGSLSYSGYTSSGVGNSVNIIGSVAEPSREDLTATFNIDSVSNVYCSFLVQVASLGTQIDYFFHFREDPVASILRGRVMLAGDGAGGFYFGISKGSTSIIDFDSTSRTFNETYLIVMKYEYVVGTNNDLIHLFVNPSLTGGEPSTPDATIPDTTGSDIIVNAVSIRQGSRDYNVILDGIRVSTSWDFAPLPVELSSFTAEANENEVHLSWITASELNNKMFEVERKTSETEYSTIAQIEGAGTTTEMNHYSYTDSDIDAGKYVYRLKQIDFDGTFAYSKEIEVEIANPTTYYLVQNYPNPFNPTTTITYAIPKEELVTLKVYNAIGEEVATLVNDVQQMGSYNVNFDASSLPSGAYMYKIQAGNYVETKKMLLLK